MKSYDWLTPELLADVLREYQEKSYKKDMPRREAARHIGAVVLNSPDAGRLALEIVTLTPDILTAAMTMLSSGIQVGLRLAEKKEGEPWLNQKSN